MAAKDIVPISIIGGIQGNVEDQLKTKLDVVDNLVYTKRGGLSSRYGTTATFAPATVPFGGTVALPVPETLASYKDELLRFGQGTVSTYSQGKDTRIYTDKASECVGTYTGIAASNRSFVYPDVATGNGYNVYVYTDDSGVNGFGRVLTTVIDAASGTALLSSFEIESGSTFARPIVFASGTTVYLVYSDDAGNIYGRTYNLATPTTWSSRTTIGTSASISPAPVPFYDACVTNGKIALAYYTATDLYCVLMSTAWVVLDGANFASATIPHCVALTGDSTRLWLGYSHDVGANHVVGWAVLNPAASVGFFSTPIAAATTLDTDAGISGISIGLRIIDATPTECAVVVGMNDETIWTARVSATPAIVLNPRDTSGAIIPRSRPWLQDGKVFVVVEDYSTLGSSLIVVDTNVHELDGAHELRPVATLVPRQLGTAGSNDPGAQVPLSSVVLTSTNTWLTSFYGPLTSDAGTGMIYTAELQFNVARQVVENNSIALVSGGVPSFYDGYHLFEAGYLSVPDAPLTSDYAGSGALSAGAYQYILVREWTDGRGNVHRSAPSAASTSLTVVASRKIQVTFTQLGLTTKDDPQFRLNPITNMIYRTVHDGSIFYPLIALPPTSDFINNTNGPSVSYIDNIADIALLTRAPLYTQGTTGALSILDNVNPPSCKFATVHKNRFWLAGTDDDSIWYSKTFVSREGPGFNEVLSLVPFEDGRVTGIASLDSYLLIFKRRSIWMVTGNGHDDSGTGSDLSDPIRITNDVGCIDFRSIVVDSTGVFFQSDGGIYLLARNTNEVVFIGEDVTDFTQVSGTEITSAVSVPAQDQIRFTRYVASAPTTSNTLVFDLLNKCWSTFSYHDQNTNAIAGAISACMADGSYNWATAAGQEYVENTSSYLDYGTTWAARRLVTSWLKLGEVQGYQRLSRIQMLGEGHTACELTMTQYNDYGATSVTSKLINFEPTSPAGAFQYEYMVMRQRSEALKLSIAITEPTVGATGTGQALTINSLVMLAHVYRGKFHQPSTHR